MHLWILVLKLSSCYTTNRFPSDKAMVNIRQT
jgi:hypothetical protein